MVGWKGKIMPDKTCAERIMSEYESRIAEIEGYFDFLSNGIPLDNEEPEYYEEWLNEHGLCFDYVVCNKETGEGGYYRWQLSWGGPSDEFRFYIGWDVKVKRIEYRFMDWFDGASVILEGKDKDTLLNVWEEFRGWMNETDIMDEILEHEENND